MTSSAGQRENVFSLINNRVDRFGPRTALRLKESEGWKSLTFKDLSERSRALASYLLESGIAHGDKIAILSESRPEWAVAFFAGIRAGATIVPLDIKLTETELVSILSDCRPKALFYDAKHAEIAAKLPLRVDSIAKTYLVDDGKGSPERPSIDQLKPERLVESKDREQDEVALIVYTSGTTGSPKGVMTTFGNLIFQINSFEDMVNLTENDRFLSILPLNHLLELTGGFLGILNMGGCITFCHSLFPQEVIKLLKEERITGMIGVPLFFKALKAGIEREIRKRGEGELERFQAGLKKAEALPIEERRKLFAAVLGELGGELRVLICGGAPLEPEIAVFFEQLGIPMLQGYGLTETSPVTTGNSLRANRIGSVGKALPGLEVFIDKKNPTDSEGEILTRGPHIMKGYHHRDDLTSEVIDKEGWFHTGDIGHLDEEGFLFITGRIKNMIVLGGGKKIFPEEVEAALSQTPLAKEICVLGRKSTGGSKEGTEEVWAVVVPADPVVKECGNDIAKIQQTLKKELDALAEHLASYKRPNKIAVSLEEFPKTATRKVKRQAVLEWLNSNT